MEITFAECDPKQVSAAILTNDMHAYNTFEDPDKVHEEVFTDYKIENGKITFTMPACERGNVPGEIMPDEEVKEVRQKYPAENVCCGDGSECYMESLYAYIARLEPEIKADEAVYEERLGICKGCDYLKEGLCGACGCFVELRL